MVPLLEIKMIHFVKELTSFTSPITESLSLTLSDPKVLERIAFHREKQGIQKTPHPYLVWSGPLNYDPGNVARGATTLKKADFWFWCHHQESMTQVALWLGEIEEEVKSYFVSHQDFSAEGIRIKSANLIDKNLLYDMVTGNEFSFSVGTIGFTFSYDLGT